MTRTKRKALLIILGVGLVGILTLFGVACAASEPTPTSNTTPSSAPTSTSSAINVEKLYAANCATCHGENRQGVSGLGDALTPEHLEDDSDAEIRETISNGIPNTTMPGFKDRLSSEEINALHQFIKYTSP